MIIKPQPKQELFLSSNADIVIFGGGAGGGKSWSLLVEPLRHRKNPRFGAVIFRRERSQITNEQGLYDESNEIYPLFGAKPNLSDLKWHFPSGSAVTLAGLQYENDVQKWHGSQIALLGFDELTHFTERQFYYMFSRNRSKSGVRPYIRATCNPDADSWLADFLAFWIDQETGYADQSKAGIIRWLYREAGRNFWANDPQTLAKHFPHIVAEFGTDVFKSVTFIPANIFDNQELLKADPGYLANLLALPLIDRERLLGGNWKIKASAGKVFNRAWFEIVDTVPGGGIDVRFWDFAATEKKLETTKKHDPDYTATVKIRYFPDLKLWYVLDAFQIQAAPPLVEKLFFQTARLDKDEARRTNSRYALRFEIEPGSASRREAYRLISKLPGFDVGGVASTEDKISRSKGKAAQAEAGNIKVLAGSWNNEYLTNLHGQPDLPHDDLFDAGNGAFNASLEIQDTAVGK